MSLASHKGQNFLGAIQTGGHEELRPNIPIKPCTSSKDMPELQNFKEAKHGHYCRSEAVKLRVMKPCRLFSFTLGP